MTPWTVVHQASVSFSISQSLHKLMFIKSVMPSNHLTLCHHLLFPPSIFPEESILHIRWPKYWSFSFNISPSMNIQDWFPLGLTGLISLLSKTLSRFFSSTTVWSNSSSVLSLLYGPVLTSIPDYWENHNFGYTDLCWQSNVSAFEQWAYIIPIIVITVYFKMITA